MDRSMRADCFQSRCPSTLRHRPKQQMGQRFHVAGHFRSRWVRPIRVSAFHLCPFRALDRPDSQTVEIALGSRACRISGTDDTPSIRTDTVRNRPNQPVDRTAAPQVFDVGESPRAAFGHWRRSIQNDLSHGDAETRRQMKARRAFAGRAVGCLTRSREGAKNFSWDPRTISLNLRVLASSREVKPPA